MTTGAAATDAAQDSSSTHLEVPMNTLRPKQVIGTLVAIAVASMIGSVLLDQHADWADPRQAAANILWISFLLSVLALIVVSVRLVVRRRTGGVR
jgi:hypothetical protein